MRRIVTSLAVIGMLAVGACSGGGSVLSFDNNSQPERVIVTVVGPTNIARVLPGAALALSATSVRGSQNGYVQANRFKWSAALTTGQTYSFAADGNQTRNCQSVLLTQSGVTVPFTTDLNFPPYATIAIDPTNEANILFIPPTTIALPTGATPGSTITTNFPYCVTVSATPIPNGTAANTGSITVVVVSPTGPVN